MPRRFALVMGQEAAGAVAQRVSLIARTPKGSHKFPEGVVMISRVMAAEVPEHVGERVTIAGWLHRRRELKSVTFLILRDSSGLAQVVLPAQARCEIPEETVLQVEGLVTASV